MLCLLSSSRSSLVFSDDLYSDVQVFMMGRVAPCVTAAEQGVVCPGGDII